MKKVMLLMLGVSLFAISCKKQETQNENNTLTDSANTSGTMFDTSGSGTMSADSTGVAGDSTMNRANTQNSQRSTAPNPTNSSNGGARSDSAR
ncbi:hypothetical protein [uncultured Chryseobacterium sp.]|uniref:hypothetical protein n=1 Tax=uncultured Chryseobacterium sp. TaxID=259322 RepID=UPI0025D4859F|nr:hypothetical protein [uncultured Chryseobacterium sp.]